jgi:hypothetical protein
MAAPPCPRYAKPLPRSAAQPLILELYALTQDGIERILREPVGLPADVPGGDYGGQVNFLWVIPSGQARKGAVDSRPVRGSPASCVIAVQMLRAALLKVLRANGLRMAPAVKR